MILAALLACGGDGGGDSAPDGPATLGELQADVFTPSCAFSTCHAAPGASGLVLEDGAAFAALVDVPSADAPGEILVIPGDPDGSYLVKKLRGDAGIVGDAMPDGAPADAATIARVASWIEAGAKDD